MERRENILEGGSLLYNKILTVPNSVNTALNNTMYRTETRKSELILVFRVYTKSKDLFHGN